MTFCKLVESNICRHCGKGREDHHDFDPYLVPEGCKCDPRDWRDCKVEPVCEAHMGPCDELCERCMHPFECHTIKKAEV